MALRMTPTPKLAEYAHPERLVTTDWLAAHLGARRPGRRRVRRGRAALRHRPHPGRGEGRLAHRAQRPGHPRLRRRRALRPDLRRARHRPRHHGGRSTATRTTGGPPTRCGCSPCSATPTCGILDGGRAKWVAEGREMTTDAAQAGGRRLPGGRARRPHRSARSRTRCWPTSASRWSTCARPASTPASCCTCPTTRRRARCAAATSRARPACRGPAPPPRTAPSSRAPTWRPSTSRSRACPASDDVVAYCRIGERSSHTWFVLTHLLGFEKVRNYDGSWTEWGNAVRVPIAQGAERGSA